MAWDAVLFDFEDTLIDLARGRGRGRYFAGMPGVPPVLDARGRPVIEAMVKLAESGVPVAVITSSPEAAMGRWFQEQQLSLALPMTVVGFHDTVLHRPSPHPLLEALHQLGLPPSRRVLAVGDSADDIEAARRAGLTTATVRPTAPLSMPPELYFPTVECFFDTEPSLALAGDLEASRRGLTLRADLDTHDCRIGGRWRARPSNRLGELLERARHGEWADELVDLADTLVSHALGSVREDAWLTAVPPHRDAPDRLGRLMARLRQRTGLRTRPLLRMAHDPGRQTSRSRAERLQAMQGCMEPRAKADLTGRTVVVVDDVRTTGATLAEAARALRAAGAARVLAVALAQEEFRSDEVSARFVPLGVTDGLADGGRLVASASSVESAPSVETPHESEESGSTEAVDEPVGDALAEGPSLTSELDEAVGADEVEVDDEAAALAVDATQVEAEAVVEAAADADADDTLEEDDEQDEDDESLDDGDAWAEIDEPVAARPVLDVDDAPVTSVEELLDAPQAPVHAPTLTQPTPEPSHVMQPAARQVTTPPVPPDGGAQPAAAAASTIAPAVAPQPVRRRASGRVGRVSLRPRVRVVAPGRQALGWVEDAVQRARAAHAAARAEAEAPQARTTMPVPAGLPVVPEPATHTRVEVPEQESQAPTSVESSGDAGMAAAPVDAEPIRDILDEVEVLPSTPTADEAVGDIVEDTVEDTVEDSTSDVEAPAAASDTIAVAPSPAPVRAPATTPAEIKARYPRAYKRWLPEEDARLSELYAQGLELQAICDDIGRQPSAVESRIRRQGLDLVEEVDADDEPVTDAPAEVEAQSPEVEVEGDVEAEADVVAPVPTSPAELKARYPRAYTRWKAEEDERLSELHAQGLELQALCDDLGRQPSAVESRIRRLGLDVAELDEPDEELDADPADVVDTPVERQQLLHGGAESADEVDAAELAEAVELAAAGGSDAASDDAPSAAAGPSPAEQQAAFDFGAPAPADPQPACVEEVLDAADEVSADVPDARDVTPSSPPVAATSSPPEPQPAAAPAPTGIKARYPRAYTRWTPEEDERLEALHGEGLELQALCDELGRQPSAVESRIRRLGLDLEDEDDEDELEA